MFLEFEGDQKCDYCACSATKHSILTDPSPDTGVSASMVATSQEAEGQDGRGVQRGECKGCNECSQFRGNMKCEYCNCAATQHVNVTDPQSDTGTTTCFSGGSSKENSRRGCILKMKYPKLRGKPADRSISLKKCCILKMKYPKLRGKPADRSISLKKCSMIKKMSDNILPKCTDGFNFSSFCKIKKMDDNSILTDIDGFNFSSFCKIKKMDDNSIQMDIDGFNFSSFCKIKKMDDNSILTDIDVLSTTQQPRRYINLTVGLRYSNGDIDDGTRTELESRVNNTIQTKRTEIAANVHELFHAELEDIRFQNRSIIIRISMDQSVPENNMVQRQRVIEDYVRRLIQHVFPFEFTNNSQERDLCLDIEMDDLFHNTITLTLPSTLCRKIVNERRVDPIMRSSALRDAIDN